MKLYHGTTEAVARLALTEGLKPRSMLEQNGDGNWKNTIESNPDCVYLTDTYAGYFAMNAAKNGEKWAIVEIDLDRLTENDLLPDEDWLEQGTRGDDSWDWIGDGMLPRTRWFRDNAALFQEHWDDSVKSMGNCCHYGAIPPDAITRVGIYDPKSNPSISMMAMDPSITPLNHMFCGRKYKALTSWLMGDEVDLMEFFSFGDGTNKLSVTLPETDSFMTEAIQSLKQELSKRSGQEILIHRRCSVSPRQDLVISNSPKLTKRNWSWVSWRWGKKWTNYHVSLDSGLTTICDMNITKEFILGFHSRAEPEKKCQVCKRRQELYSCPDCGEYCPPEAGIRSCPKHGMLSIRVG